MYRSGKKKEIREGEEQQKPGLPKVVDLLVS